MDRRTLLAIVLSFFVVMGYQYFFLKKTPPQTGVVDQRTSTSTYESKEIKQERELEKTTQEGLALPRQKSLTKNAYNRDKGKDVIVESPLYSAIFNSQGGVLKSFKLKNYREEVIKDAKLIELVKVREDVEYPLGITFPESSIEIPSHALYETDTESLDLSRIQESKKLVFSWSYPDEIRVEKIYTFYPEKYIFDLEVVVYNLSADPITQKALLSWKQFFDPSAKSDRYAHVGPISYVKNEIISEKVSKIKESEVLGPDVSWGGFESKYFIASMIPELPSLTNLVISKYSENIISADLKGPKNTIMPGQSGTFRYSLYLGPKDYTILKAEKIGLENSIDFGSWLKWLSLPLLMSLKFIYNYVHNYGVAIILLTVLVKMIFWPLGNMSYRSMREMQKLQPQITKLREKYKDEKERLNQEVMGLYKIHKVNPMGGCLPILIQIPVFFGLYKTLLYSIELRHSPFFLWIQDLSAKDPYYITPIIMGATMLLQQRMTPQPGGDAMQAKIMMWMPVVFTFLFLNFPSGLVIYWLFNNILSIGQQHYINTRTS